MKGGFVDRDEIWQQIKNDKFEIYGQSMLDVFLQVTDSISEPHFFELNKDQISKLSGDAIYTLLYYADDVKKIADLIGHNINKLSVNHVYELLKKDNNQISNIAIRSGEEAAKLARQKYRRRNAILEYKNINNDRDIYSLLAICPDRIECIKDTLDVIGEERLNYLEPISIYKILHRLRSLDHTGEAFELFAKKLKSNIEKIPEGKVIELIPSFRGGTEGSTWTAELNYLEKIMKSLGEKNLNKLDDKAIKHLLTYGPIKFREKIASVLGDLRNKLSDESISTLVDEAMRSPSSSSKIIDLVGEERFKKWFGSPEGQKEIGGWKRVIDLQDKKQHTQKYLDLFKQNLDSLYRRLGVST